MEDQDADQVKVLAAQLGRWQDKMSARMDRIEESIRHHSELETEKTAALRSELALLRKAVEDHEARIRNCTDGVTSFKVFSGLASGGSSVLSVVALVKAFFGL
jgi:type II secretory pathway component PulJ